MLRGFFLIFLLVGDRARRRSSASADSTAAGSPIELFPDMVRQTKVRAQAPFGFFADDRGSRVPVAGTVPIGYEMPKPKAQPSPGRARCRRVRSSIRARV